MSKRLLNPLWQHFSDCDAGKAKCVHCDKVISRGAGGAKYHNTTNIWNHLRSSHGEIYLETKKKKEEMMKGGAKSQQMLVQQLELSMLPQSHKWKESNSSSKKLDRLIIEMCATDKLPFSVVKGKGFQRLLESLEPRYEVKSEKYYRSEKFEFVYKTLQTSIRMLISAKRQEPSLSFTADCVYEAEESLMSFTGHFIDEHWERRQVMLHVKAMTQASTEDYIHQFFLSLLKYWRIDQKRVFLVLRDGGADVSEEERLREVPGLCCSAQTLQSVVEEGIQSQQDAADIITKVRTCFQHFQESIIAKQRIRVIQDELNVPQNDIHPDANACWISLLQMLRSAYEQRRALNSYAQKYSHLSQFSVPTNSEWDLVKSIIDTLTTVEEVAREMSNMDSLISCVIPNVAVLKMLLQTSSAATKATTVLRETMLSALQERYALLENTKVLVLATLLDPRYKCNMLSAPALSSAPKWLNEEHTLWKMLQEEEGEEEAANPGGVATVKEEEEENPAGAELVEHIFNRLLGSPSAVVEHRSPELSGQLEQYLNEPLIDRKKDDPLKWWKSNRQRFDLLAPLARKFLSPPPACIPSSRLFASTETQEKGARTSGEHAEKLYFIRHNLPLVRYEY